MCSRLLRFGSFMYVKRLEWVNVDSGCDCSGDKICGVLLIWLLRWDLCFSGLFCLAGSICFMRCFAVFEDCLDVVCC